MARIFTTPEAELAAKSFMHDITLAAGLRSKSQRQGSSYSFDARYVKAAQEICDELVNRNFNNIDKSVQEVSYYGFHSSLSSNAWKHYKPDAVAKAIVYIAELLGLYWDDTIRTPYEIDEFKKTLLGALVYKYGRYISAIQDKQPTKRKAAPNGNTPQVASSAPQNDYKQQGPKSSQARGLVSLDGTSIPTGQPGEKVFIDKGYALAIRGTVAGKQSEVRAVVMPLNPKGAAGEKNKVFINASHGYGVCECLFDEMDDAVNFYNQIVSNNRVPNDVASLQVVKIKVDKNGYFLTDTEFGICAIAAKVLNEAIDESEIIEEDLGAGWKKATEGYTKEQLDDLHSWMRKD